MTYIEKFEYLKENYGKTPDMTKLTQSFAAQIELTDEDCHGIFYIAYMNGVLSVEPYDYRDNTVNIIVSSAVLEDMLTGKISPVEAYNSSILQADGDLGHALMLIEALKKEETAAVKKATVKKAAEKKPAAKKAAEKKPAAKKADEKKAAVKTADEKKAAVKTADEKKHAAKKTPAAPKTASEKKKTTAKTKESE